MKHLDNAGQTLEMELAQGDLNGHNPRVPPLGLGTGRAAHGALGRGLDQNLQGRGLAQNRVSDRQSCQV